jgi:hypothetical protein
MHNRDALIAKGLEPILKKGQGLESARTSEEQDEDVDDARGEAERQKASMVAVADFDGICSQHGADHEIKRCVTL